ncbi:hypothetical protein Cgig2_005756 [Carnegiea gigantea]|uniref:Uncharacterized protein n=1 Tax=Carnegiea gigantea TaxID=171969 RepID=A0A9Q1GQ09_9CARY|nr:hypothetical protein Cgig2_005756 [Carnegiea gigantea]
MVFGGKEAPRFASPHNDPLVVEMKIASAIVSVDSITWDCFKKLKHPGRDIVPLVHPILGFGEQEVNPTGMIRLPVRFGDKLKAKNLEVDFLVIDVPTAYNVILGCPTLHKLHVGLFAVLTALIFRSPSVSVQRVGRLVFWAVSLTRKGDELDLLRISPLGFGPLALIHIIEVSLEVGVIPKFLG